MVVDRSKGAPVVGPSARDHSVDEGRQRAVGAAVALIEGAHRGLG